MIKQIATTGLSLTSKYWAVLVLVILFLLYSKYGKASSNKIVVSTTNDKDKDNIPDSWTPDVITQDVYNAMEDYWAWKTYAKEALWKEISVLTDGQLKLIYNYYNTNYSKEVGQTFTQKIKSEQGFYFASSKHPLLERLKTLNLN